MKAHSSDLRERVVQAVDEGTDKAEVARVYRIGLATVNRYLRLRREAGHLTAKTSPGRPRRIPAHDEPALLAQVLAYADDTLEQHCDRWAAEQGVRSSLATMCRAQARVKLTRKKDGAVD